MTFYVVDQWGVIVKTFDNREEAESYVTIHHKLHVEEAE